MLECRMRVCSSDGEQPARLRREPGSKPTLNKIGRNFSCEYCSGIVPPRVRAAGIKKSANASDV